MGGKRGAEQGLAFLCERSTRLPVLVWEHWDRGLCDREIAEALGYHQTTVQSCRQRMGLPPNPDRVGRESRLQAVQRHLREEEFESLAQLRAHKQRIACLLRGWAGAQSFRQCAVLDVLQDGGPQTLSQIKQALGGYPRALRTTLRRLRALKLVSVQERPEWGRGRGCGPQRYLYSLRRGVKRQYRSMPNEEDEP
jgi:hypothetical protein